MCFVHLYIKNILSPAIRPKDFMNTVLVPDQTLAEGQRVLDLAYGSAGLAVPRGCLQFVIVVFPDHTHLLFLGILQRILEVWTPDFSYTAQ